MRVSCQWGRKLLCLTALLLSVPAGAANIVINNLDGPGEGFNDPTPVSPVGGNPGTTLGQQRLNAFNRAAQIWGGAIDSSVTIQVDAALDPLSCDSRSAVLGSAGPVEVLRDFPNAPVSNTWYHVALANSLAGYDLTSSSSDITATFNSAIDNNNNCLNGISWYLGFDDNGGGDVSLLVVLLHEFAHGLGFSTFTDVETGRFFFNRKDVFALQTYDNSSSASWDQMNNNQRVTSATNTGNVVWESSRVTGAAMSLLTSGKDGDGDVKLYAPSQVEPTSSISHFDVSASPNVLMEPNINLDVPPELDLTDELMLDLGWTIFDTDGDGLSDTDEDVLGTNPNLIDTDGDGLTDGGGIVPVAAFPGGVDGDNDGAVDGEQDLGTNPNDSDTDDDGVTDGAEVLRGTSPTDQAPSLSILQPADGSNFSAGTSISFTASATDQEDGDLSSAVQWVSSRDGSLGQGEPQSFILSAGSHTVTASVTDSQGDTATDLISLTVTQAQPDGDVNGDGKLDVADLFLLQEHLSGLNNLTGPQAQRADVYPDGGDGSLDIGDLSKLQQLLAPE